MALGVQCTRCDLHYKCKSNNMKSESDGHNVKIMLVLDTPDREEDRSAKSFVGDTYKKLAYFLEKTGIRKEDLFITYAIRCKPYSNSSDIKKKHVNACRPFLLQEIARVRPKLIIPMGKFAHWAISDQESLNEFRGHFKQLTLNLKNSFGEKEAYHFDYIPTFSPNTSLYEWRLDEYIIHDLKKANNFLKTKIIPQTKLIDYQIITNKNQLKDFYDYMMSSVKYAVADFETTGLRFFEHEIINSGYCDGKKNFILYHSGYTKEYMKKWDSENKEFAKEINSFVSQNRELIKKVANKVHGSDINWIFHNGKFDCNFARYFDIPFKNFFFDTLNADSLIDENRFHSLNLAMEIRDINFGPYDTELWEYVGKKTKKSYKFAPPLLLSKYLAIDTYGDWLLFKKQVPELKSEGMLQHFMEVKMEALKIMTNAEYEGVPMDRKKITEVDNMLKEKMAILQTEIDKVTGIEGFNVNSPQQVVAYMIDQNYPFERLKIKRNKTGYKTDKDSMLKFKAIKKYEKFPSLVLKYKALAKVAGTYVAGKIDRKPDELGGMLQYLDQNDRVHANWNLFSPKTGRYSCFPVDTPVLQLNNDGYFVTNRIGDIEVGSEVVSCDTKETSIIHGKKTLNNFDNGMASVGILSYRIENSTDARIWSVQCTANHKIYVFNKGYVEASKLVSGDLIVGFRGVLRPFISFVDNIAFTKVRDLEVEDFHNYFVGEYPILVSNCNKPSLQVWPRPIPELPNLRNFVTTYEDDEILWEVDFSQLEQCVVAGLSRDIKLTENIQNDVDLHCDNAIDLGKVLGMTKDHVTYEYIMVAVGKGGDLKYTPTIQIDDITKEEKGELKEVRTMAKAIGFGLNYGKSFQTFATDFGISPISSKNMVDAYFKKYFGMYNWREDLIRDGFEKGYITLLSGRKRRVKYAVDWLKSKYAKGVWSADKLKGEIERQLMNFPVQGGAHEVFEPAKIRIHRRFKKEGINAKLLLSIHDGMVGTCKRHEKEKVRQILLEEMPYVFNKGTKFELTLKVDVDFYESHWYGDKVK